MLGKGQEQEPSIIISICFLSTANSNSGETKKGVLIKGKKEKVTVIKEHSNDEATEWDCESSLVLTLDWTLNAMPRSRTLTFECGECN